MFTLLVGIAFGIFLCMFIPPKEIATKIITATIAVCNILTEKGKEQLEKIEKENEKERNSEQD